MGSLGSTGMSSTSAEWPMFVSPKVELLSAWLLSAAAADAAAVLFLDDFFLAGPSSAEMKQEKMCKNNTTFAIVNIK